MKKIIFTLGALFLVSILSFGQFQKNRSATTGQKFKLETAKKRKAYHRPVNFINNLGLSIGSGTTYYYGDLQYGIDLTKLNPNLNLGLKYRISEHVALRAEINYFHIEGKDTDRNKRRGLSFQSDNIEFGGQVIYDLFAYRKMYRQRKKASPYLFAGVSGLLFFPKGKVGNESYFLSKHNVEKKDFSSFTMTIPLGLGVRVGLSPFAEIMLESRWNYTFTDYLDGVSGYYPESTEGMSEIDIALSGGNSPDYVGTGKRRGNPATRDGYFSFDVKFLYVLKVTHQKYNINSNLSRFRMIGGVKKKRH